MGEAALDRFIAALPDKPYATNDFERGLRIMERRHAVKRAYIQLHGVQRRYLPFDIDRPGAAFAWEDAGLPAPTLTIVDPENGHAHLLYELETPVVFLDRNGRGRARKGPMDYYRAVLMAYGNRLGADPAYRGVTVKNPLHNRWELIHFDRPRDLAELAESVDLRSSRSFERSIPSVEDMGVVPDGFRNETIFNSRLLERARLRPLLCIWRSRGR